MSWHERLIDRLKELAENEDRAALASLRRSLDGEVQSFAGAARVVARFLPRDLKPWEENDAYLVAALFALAPSSSGLALARALRRVATETGSTSIELRFTALLAASREDLPTHLRHAVTLTRGAGIDLDWAALLKDVLRWGAPSGATQKNWAREFWASNTVDETTSNTTEGNTP
jgi:CRISPR type I-E-associated protein CasB/Cse2